MATAITPLGTFIKFHQFAKLEESESGNPTVWGVATWEKPDSDNEICDFDTAKPVYQTWSAKAFKRTKGAGQEPSLGNIRLQHGSDVGGKATKLEFHDDDKEIWLGSEPINDEVHTALKKGFYTGYSQGGSYAWRACNTCEGQLPMQQGYNYCEHCKKSVAVRYGLKRLAEVSYVDSPAIGEGFEHVKANGSCEIVKFAKRTEGDSKVSKEAKTKRVAGEELPASHFAFVGDPEKTETWKLPIKFSTDEKTKRHIRNALARFEQTKGIPEDKKEEVKAKIHAAAKEHDIKVTEETSDKADEATVTMLRAAIEKRMTESGLVTKNLWDVGTFAEILQRMAYLYESAVWEREVEGDDSEVPDEMRDHLEGMIETFIAMAAEEARELAARTNKTEQGEASMTQEELDAINKAAKKSLATHFAKAATHHEKMADHHEETAVHHEAMGEAHKSAHEAIHKLNANTNAEGEDKGSSNELNSATVSFHKAAQKEHVGLAGKHMKMAKAHKAMCEHCAKMSESHDEEESKKVMKAEREAYAVEKAATPQTPAPVVKTAADADVEFGRKATEKAQADLLNDPEFMKEVKDRTRQSLLGKLSAEGAEALAKEAIVPTGVRIIPRGGEPAATKFEFAESSTPAGNNPF